MEIVWQAQPSLRVAAPGNGFGADASAYPVLQSLSSPGSLPSGAVLSNPTVGANGGPLGHLKAQNLPLIYPGLGRVNLVLSNGSGAQTALAPEATGPATYTLDDLRAAGLVLMPAANPTNAPLHAALGASSGLPLSIPIGFLPGGSGTLHKQNSSAFFPAAGLASIPGLPGFFVCAPPQPAAPASGDGSRQKYPGRTSDDGRSSDSSGCGPSHAPAPSATARSGGGSGGGAAAAAASHQRQQQQQQQQALHSLLMQCPPDQLLQLSAAAAAMFPSAPSGSAPRASVGSGTGRMTALQALTDVTLPGRANSDTLTLSAATDAAAVDEEQQEGAVALMLAANASRKRLSAGAGSSRPSYSRPSAQQHSRPGPPSPTNSELAEAMDGGPSNLAIAGSGTGGLASDVAALLQEHAAANGQQGGANARRVQLNRNVPSFADVVQHGLVPKGRVVFSVGNLDQVEVLVTKSGVIVFGGTPHPSISSFALAVLKERNPDRRACDGWREVRYNGVRMCDIRRACLQKMLKSGQL